jgi:hypothetical protein
VFESINNDETTNKLYQLKLSNKMPCIIPGHWKLLSIEVSYKNSFNQAMCYLPDSCPLMNTCKAWPADKIVRKGYFPLFRNSSLASIITLGRKENTFNPWHMKFIRKCFVNKYTKKKKQRKNFA